MSGKIEDLDATKENSLNGKDGPILDKKKKGSSYKDVGN